MGLSDLEPDKQRKYDELKKKYQSKSKFEVSKKQVEPESLSEVINSLQNQIEKHGSHIFKEGAVVIPGAIQFNANYTRVKFRRC